MAWNLLLALILHSLATFEQNITGSFAAYTLE